MTPQERLSVSDLFEKLARLESAPRDPEAERAIAQGLAQAPHAIYPLVQTVLVQDEALKRADARIRELSGQDEPSEQSGGFLDNMRNILTGGARGSVPSVRPNQSDARWNSGGALASAAAPQSNTQANTPGFGGGSFLGTAAASAAGMIGGALLLNSISSMFGNRGGSAFAGEAPQTTDAPWSGVPSDNDLSRIANDRGGERAGLFDSGDADVADLGGDSGGDFGGGGGDVGGGDS